MKYLSSGRPGAVPIPPEQAVGIYQAAKEWMNARLAEGTVDCHYVFPDRGGFVIGNADSHEEILDRLMEYPLYPFLDWEVRPLCDWSHAYDKAIEFFQKLAG